MNQTAKKNEHMLHKDMGRFFADPYGFVMYAYEWGVGELERFDGPDEWQKDFLISWGNTIRENGFDGHVPVKPVRKARVSGHGIGKSALTAWIVDFIMSTRPYCKGTVTANTSAQLETKTWAEVAKWTRRCITGHWFSVSTGRGSMKMYHKKFRESWYCAAQTCREENSEAFAGQHAVNSTSFYIFDEASAVPDKIFEVAEGGLTDGEPMFFLFGNPTRNTGKFRECFKVMRHRWDTAQIDSRDVKITNKAQLQEWIDDYGEDSDFVRVRCRGIFPRAGVMQYIPSDIVEAAAEHPGYHRSVYDHAPKLLGVDVAGEGDDQSVIIRRQGIVASGLRKFRELNTMQLASIVATEIKEWEPDAVFVDMVGIGAGVVDRLHQLKYKHVIGVNAGHKASNDNKYFNLRTEMWGLMKEWLEAGAMIPNDTELRDDLIGPEYGYDPREREQLERKKDMKLRGLASPDSGDALSFTFAQPVSKTAQERAMAKKSKPKYDPRGQNARRFKRT